MQNTATNSVQSVKFLRTTLCRLCGRCGQIVLFVPLSGRTEQDSRVTNTEFLLNHGLRLHLAGQQVLERKKLRLGFLRTHTCRPQNI